MFKITDFSRLTRVTVKMLRHYNDIGLLTPQYVDPANGYRYYSADQLPRLNRIIALKDLGFSLEQIATLLDAQLSPDAHRTLLQAQRTELAERIAADQMRLAQIDLWLRETSGARSAGAMDVVLRPLPPFHVAVIRTIVPGFGDAVAALFNELESTVAAQQCRDHTRSPLMLLHDNEYREDDCDIEVAVPITAPFTPTGRVQSRELPGAALAACVVYTGDYVRTAIALQAILQTISAQGYRVAGPIREVYVRFGADNAEDLGFAPRFLAHDAGSFVTEVQVPLDPL